MTAPMTRTVRPSRARRTCLAVPGSNPRMLAKATGLGADEVFLDLEDAVAPGAKADARALVVEAVNRGGWDGKTLVVRINDVTGPWALDDLITIVRGAGAGIDAIMLPKVDTPDAVTWLDLTLTQLEMSLGLAVGRIGIEAQIESALGLTRANEIAVASPRMETLVFGPTDFSASMGMRALSVGALTPDYPGDLFHHALSTILTAARAAGIQAMDGPFFAIPDLHGLRGAARRAAILGFDGKWVLHPSQIEIVNDEFTPGQAEYDRAEAILAAYEEATSAIGGLRGAIMLGDEMLDEATRKLALGIAAKGRAAGMRRS